MVPLADSGAPSRPSSRRLRAFAFDPSLSRRIQTADVNRITLKIPWEDSLQKGPVDDYLEVRPAEAGRLTRLNCTGRLAMGPWYTLPDEFLVSGETLVRNLRLGLDRAATFGGAMPVGYLPDMFGHVAQMPQILRSFGFEHAVVWRGVPAAVDRSAFHWTAHDGSTVRAEYLAGGYGNVA